MINEILVGKDYITSDIDNLKDKIKIIKKIKEVENKRLYRNLFNNNKQRRTNRWK